MSDPSSLIKDFQSHELVRPSPTTLNIVDLAGALAQLSGTGERLQSPNTDAIRDMIGDADHIVLIIADGLGMNVMATHGDDTFLNHHIVTELQTVFPTSTPVVLTSLATGLWPCKHGIPGWNVYLEEIDVVAEIIRYSRTSDAKDLSSLGMQVTEAFPVRPIVSEFNRDIVSYLPESIANTPFSKYTSGGAKNEGYVKLTQAATLIYRHITTSKSNTISYLYIPDIDTASHQFGTNSSEVKRTLGEIEQLVLQLKEILPSGSRLILTADHGLLDFTDDQSFQIHSTDPIISTLTNEPWGTSRVRNFDVLPGETINFETIFVERYGKFFHLLTADDAEKLELYGPGNFSPVTRRRIGSHVAISKGAWILEYIRPSSENSPPKLSQHGGLTREEMLVPLMVA